MASSSMTRIVPNADFPLEEAEAVHRLDSHRLGGAVNQRPVDAPRWVADDARSQTMWVRMFLGEQRLAYRKHPTIHE